MPQFTSRPPAKPTGYGLDLIRTPANGRITLALTCENIIGCPTHWYGGRTIPCEEVECPGCAATVSWRWHGYVSGLVAPTRRQVLMEFTAQASETIADYHDSQGTLRGSFLVAQRHRNRHNGRVIVALHAAELEKLNLPAPPDVTASLAIIWNVPQTAIAVDGKTDRGPRLTVNDPEKGNNRPAAIATGPPTAAGIQNT